MGQGDITMSHLKADMLYTLGLLEQWFPTYGPKTPFGSDKIKLRVDFMDTKEEEK